MADKPVGRLTRRSLLNSGAGLCTAGMAQSVPFGIPAHAAEEEALRDKSIGELADAVQSGQIKAVTLAHAVIAAQTAHADLNGFITFIPDQLRQDAEAVDQAVSRGDVLGPLAGIPIALKDNINTKDYPTSGGTPALAGNKPKTDATVAARLQAAGAIIAGKANMHELSAGGASDNATFGAVGNPYDPSRVPGGSSGGPAALVAARIVPGAIGTDTAGSIRVPAALCGVVGLRPSQDRYLADGIVPLSMAYDTAGPIAKSVADVAVLDEAITGEGHLPEWDRPIRLGIARSIQVDISSDEIRSAFDEVLNVFSGHGIEIIEVDFEGVSTAHSAIPPTVIAREFVDVMRSYLQEHGPGTSLQDLVDGIASPAAKTFIGKWIEGSPPDAAFRSEYRTAIAALRKAHADMYDRHLIDAMVMPATPQVALPRAVDDQVILNEEAVSSWLYYANTRFAAVSGIPGLALPIALSQDGLPISLELDGRFQQDRALLSVAAQLEGILPALPPPTI